jgi:hypothetical protein
MSVVGFREADRSGTDIELRHKETFCTGAHRNGPKRTDGDRENPNKPKRSEADANASAALWTTVSGSNPCLPATIKSLRVSHLQPATPLRHRRRISHMPCQVYCRPDSDADSRAHRLNARAFCDLCDYRRRGTPRSLPRVVRAARLFRRAGLMSSRPRQLDRMGVLPPRYSFFLNPHPNERVTVTLTGETRRRRVSSCGPPGTRSCTSLPRGASRAAASTSAQWSPAARSAGSLRGAMKPE